MSLLRPRRTTISRIALGLLLLGCGGGAPAPTAPPPVPPEPLPVLSQLIITAPGDTLRASETVPAALVARDTKAREMTVGFVAWRSSNPAILSVATDGTVLALAPGRVTLTATVGEVTGARSITVLPRPPGPLPVAAIEVTPFITDLDVGDALQLNAVPRDFAGAPLANRAVAFTSSDTSVALVAADGNVTGRGVGTALIDVTSEGKRSAAYFRVRAPIDTSVVVSVGVPLPDAAVGDSMAIKATVRSVRPLASVVAMIAGRSAPMQMEEVVSISGVVRQIWVLTADVSLVPYGPFALVVTATDITGARGVRVIPLVRNPNIAGGSARPPANK